MPTFLNVKVYFETLHKILSTSCNLSGLSLEIKTQLLSGCQMLWKFFSFIGGTFPYLSFQLFIYNSVPSVAPRVWT